MTRDSVTVNVNKANVNKVHVNKVNVNKVNVNKVNVNKVNVKVNVNKANVKVNVNKVNDKLNDIYSIHSHYKGGGRWPPPQKRCRGLTAPLLWFLLQWL